MKNLPILFNSEEIVIKDNKLLSSQLKILFQNVKKEKNRFQTEDGFGKISCFHFWNYAKEKAKELKLVLKDDKNNYEKEFKNLGIVKVKKYGEIYYLF